MQACIVNYLSYCHVVLHQAGVDLFNAWIHTFLINDGIVFNRDDPGATYRGEGTLEFCRMQNITVQAWSPLARGAVSGRSLANAEARIKKTAAVVDQLAEEKGVGKEAIVIAWLLKKVSDNLVLCKLNN